LVTQFEQFIQLPLNRLVESSRLPMLKRDASKLTHAQAVMANKYFGQTIYGHNGNNNHGGNNVMSQSMQMRLQGDLGLLMSLCHTRKLLLVHGLNSMRSNVMNTFQKAGGSRAKAAMVASPQWKRFVSTLDTICMKGDASANPKIGKLKQVLVEHFARYQAGGTRTSVIVFTQFRDSVAEICRALETSTQLRVSPFVGQSSTKGAADRAKAAKKAAAAALLRGARRPAGAAPIAAPSAGSSAAGLNAEMDRSMLAMGLVDAQAGSETGLEDSAAMRGQKQVEQQRIVEAFRNGTSVSLAALVDCLLICFTIRCCIRQAQVVLPHVLQTN
jgi:ERCC4-related helicase